MRVIMMMIMVTVLLDQVVNLFVFTLKKPFSDLQLHNLLIKFPVFAFKLLYPFLILLGEDFEVCIQLVKPFKYLAELVLKLITHSYKRADYSIGFGLL